jgi:hypothetical protein
LQAARKAGSQIKRQYTFAMNDPVSAANTFATLVALICNYRQEKGAREQLSHQEFVEWLEYHRHEEIKNLIVNTAALRTEVDQILRADHEIIMAKLDAISTALSTSPNVYKGLMWFQEQSFSITSFAVQYHFTIFQYPFAGAFAGGRLASQIRNPRAHCGKIFCLSYIWQ